MFHHVVFLYEALKRIHVERIGNQQTCFDVADVAQNMPFEESFGEANKQEAVRAWLGYQPLADAEETCVFTKLFGKVNERQHVIEFCEGKFRTLYGEDFRVKPRQREILSSISGRCVELNCCAGAGKSTLLHCLCLWALHICKRDGAESVCLHYRADTKEMVDEFLTELCILHGDDGGIVPLGYRAALDGDALKFDINNKCMRGGVPSHVEFERLGQFLDLLVSWDKCFVESDACHPSSSTLVIEDCLRIVSFVMYAHHMLLVGTFYPRLYEKQQVYLDGITIIGSTCAYFAKMLADHSGAARVFRQRKNVLSLVDEAQSSSPCEVAVCGSFSQGLLFAGNQHQSIRVDPKKSRCHGRVAQEVFHGMGSPQSISESHQYRRNATLR